MRQISHILSSMPKNGKDCFDKFPKKSKLIDTFSKQKTKSRLAGKKVLLFMNKM